MRLRYVRPFLLAGLVVAALIWGFLFTNICACSPPPPPPPSGDAQSTIYDKLLTGDSVRSRR